MYNEERKKERKAYCNFGRGVFRKKIDMQFLSNNAPLILFQKAIRF